MSKPIDRVEAEALELPIGDRARLARRLLESLEQSEAKDPRAVERAWQVEIERRIAEFDAGSVTTIPAAEVFAEARVDAWSFGVSRMM